jgi:hypothetical protein
MIRLAGEVFKNYNQPKRDVQGGKEYAVAAKEGDTVRLVRFGDPNMENRSDEPDRRAAFRSRHSCDEKKSKLTPGYWSCRNWVLLGLVPSLAYLWTSFGKEVGDMLC